MLSRTMGPELGGAIGKSGQACSYSRDETMQLEQ